MNQSTNQEGISLAEQRLIETINETSAELLKEDPERDFNSMSEEAFVRVFLPMFANDPVQHYGATIETWLKLTKGPYKEMRILDPLGKELFRVPPLFNKAAMKPLDGTNEAATLSSLVSVIARANLIAKQGENRMTHFLQEEFAKRSFMFNNKKDETEYLVRWNEIFKRYNRPLIPLTTADLTGAVPNGADSQEFDPL
jgi:hypothetical protein